MLPPVYSPFSDTQNEIRATVQNTEVLKDNSVKEILLQTSENNLNSSAQDAGVSEPSWSAFCLVFLQKQLLLDAKSILHRPSGKKFRTKVG